MAGKLYGVGVGPGDVELLTMKAYRLLRDTGVIAVPIKKKGEESTALAIIRKVINLEEKEIIRLEFPMEHTGNALEKSHHLAAQRLCRILEKGRDVVLITLGDVSLYSTCSYVLWRVREHGYEIEMVPGVPSFCDAAARAGIPLAQGHEDLAVLSASNQREPLECALDHFENVVIMKAGSRMPLIVEILQERELMDRSWAAENIGMENETIGRPDPERSYGYFTTVIVKKGGIHR